MRLNTGKTVKIASVPAQIISKGIPTAGLLAWIVISKFCDSLPLYSQVRILKRIGVEISLSTMASWMIQVAEKCMPIIDLLKEQILSGFCINIDETTLQVMNEPGRSNTTKSFMWVFRGGTEGKPAVIFQYSAGRKTCFYRGLFYGSILWRLNLWTSILKVRLSTILLNCFSLDLRYLS